MWTQQVFFTNKSFKKIKKSDQSTVMVIEKYDVER